MNEKDENTGFTTHEVMFFKGQPPEQTEWWTKEQWKEHEKYVEESKETGEYMQPVMETYHIMNEPMFDLPASNKTIFRDFGLFIPVDTKK